MIHGSLYRVLIYGGPCKIGLMVCLDRSDWMFGWLGSWGAPELFPRPRCQPSSFRTKTTNNQGRQMIQSTRETMKGKQY